MIEPSISGGFDPSPWIAANAVLAARLGAGRRSGFGLAGGSSLASEGLVGRTITGAQDEERARRLPGIAGLGAKGGGGSGLGVGGSGFGGAGLGDLLGLDGSVRGHGLAGADAASPLTTAGLLARGYQPAVVKVVSYAHGVARATASAQYVERDDVALETHDGLRLPDKEAVAEEIKAWSSSFEKRSPSQDVVAVRVQLSGLRNTTGDREVLGFAVAAAFEGHRHAVRIDVQRDGVLEARVVAVMARTISPEEKATGSIIGEDGVKRPAQPPRIRVVDQRMGTTEDAPSRKVFDPRSEAAMKAQIEERTGRSAHSVSIEPATPGHGRDALGQRLATLVSKGPARDHEGKPVRSADDIRDITRDWGRHLRSQSPRDTMHMVVSAKAGTDAKDFTNAVRSFLHDQFQAHKFMFGVHTDKAEAGHIHAHAIVAVRSEQGTKLHPGPADLAQWRLNYAFHAREHGLQVVATRAVEQASSRSYGSKDKSIVDVATTPRPERKELDRAYASDPRNASIIRKAQDRIETARANPIRIPETERERAGVRESLEYWRTEAKADPAHVATKAMVERLTAAKEAGDLIGALKAAIMPKTTASDVLTVDPSRSPPEKVPAPVMSTHPEKSASDMLQDLRILNQKAADVAALLPEGSRAKFLERAGTYLERIADRVDQQRAEEAKAEQIARVEAREAEQAARSASRAVEADRKLEGAPLAASGVPTGLDQKRALLREAERQASTETQEAKAAREAARTVSSDSARPIPSSQFHGERLAEIRRKQAELIEKFTQERARSREREHEAGD